eukprot:CAMPEP_0197598702 /NCGR_PEP_ID=MMETSP1326-20131121/29877_1 /TAXON_ID=1155430 /ORGANISM="Genus nov. species nov., Strain RCC2288" /LENGTH=163 /DNA_ID=CAMNT_0043165549 /DNA_START=134 /DNA_END=622 /DNA_ORIENTATION=-
MSRDSDDSIAIPGAPNWFGSNLADWGGAHGSELYAYAARNVIVLMRPSGAAVSATAARATLTTPTNASASASASATFTGTLVGHSNRVTALAFARCGGVEHLLVSGSADKQLRLWDTSSRRCVKVLKGHTAEISAVSTSPIAADLAVSGDRTGRVLVWRFGGA